MAKFRDGSYRSCDIITDDKTRVYRRQIHDKSKNASWLGESELATTVVHRSKFEAKISFLFCLNQMVLFLYIVFMKARL